MLDTRVAVQLLIYGLTNGAVVALNAIGFTLAYSVARQINLAHGNVFALSTVVVASLAGWLGVTADAPLWQRGGALLLLVAAGAACGSLLNGAVERLAFRPFRGAGGDSIAPLIATVGLSFVLLQVAIWWRVLFPNQRSLQSMFLHNGVVVPLLSMPDLLPRVELGWGGVSFTLKDVVVLVVAGGVALAVGTMLSRTSLGRLLRAAAHDPELTSLSGGDPRRAQFLAFALSGALAGLGAAIFAAYYGAASGQFGLRTGLAAITAAVLGGVGNPRGALTAGVVLGIVGSFNDYLLDPQWTPVLVLVLLIGLLAWRPGGMLSTAPISSTIDDSAERPLPTVADPARPGTHWLLLGLLALGAAYPFVDELLGWHRLASVSVMLLLVALGVGLSLVVGSGLLDLGYAAFFAIGGYTAALLTSSGSRLSLALPEAAREPWIALPLAGLLAAGFGIAFGLPSIRTRGEYLAIVTLAFGEIVPGVIWHLPYWTGGANGLSGVPLPSLVLALGGSDRAAHAYTLALLLAMGACVAALRLARSREGRAWAAVREDETAAAAAGIPIAQRKLLAFALGAGCAGLAGAVYAGLLSYIEPGLFDFTVSLMVLAAVVIGGRWGLGGVVLGALTVAAYDRVLADLLTSLLRGAGSATGVTALSAADLHGASYALFGVALYAAILLRSRPRMAPRVSGAVAATAPA
jgi:branched-chain amino acid transport system permease protein